MTVFLALALTVAQQNVCFANVELLERLEAAQDVRREARLLRLEGVPQQRIDVVVKAFRQDYRARELTQDCADAAVGETE